MPAEGGAAHSPVLPEGQGFPLFEAVRPDRHLSDGSGRASGGDGDGEPPGAAAGAQLGEPGHELRHGQRQQNRGRRPGAAPGHPDSGTSHFCQLTVNIK